MRSGLSEGGHLARFSHKRFVCTCTHQLYNKCLRIRQHKPNSQEYVKINGVASAYPLANCGSFTNGLMWWSFCMNL